jgi:hypothetical protein
MILQELMLEANAFFFGSGVQREGIWVLLINYETNLWLWSMF